MNTKRSYKGQQGEAGLIRIWNWKGSNVNSETLPNWESARQKEKLAKEDGWSTITKDIFLKID